MNIEHTRIQETDIEKFTDLTLKWILHFNSEIHYSYSITYLEPKLDGDQQL